MSANSTGFKDLWIRRKGSTTSPIYRVSRSTGSKYVFQYEMVTFEVPIDDYEQCDPPAIDVTNELHTECGFVYHHTHKIAELCCGGNYRITFQPLKVEKIR